jgi:hypothetical protein
MPKYGNQDDVAGISEAYMYAIGLRYIRKRSEAHMLLVFTEGNEI